MAANVLGVTTQGAQQVTVTSSANLTIPPVGMIRGLNVGVNTLPALHTRPGIQRLSATAGIGWQDGHLGNDVRLYFTATDVMPTVSSGPRTVVQWQQGGTSRPPVVYSTSPTPNTSWCVAKLLPTGFALGKEMCIMTQDFGNPVGPSPPGSPLALTLSVVWYPMSGVTWSLAGATDVTPTVPTNPVIQTDTALALGGVGAPSLSGTGLSAATEQIMVSILSVWVYLAYRSPKE